MRPWMPFLCIVIITFGCQRRTETSSLQSGRYAGFENFDWPITTSSRETQEWFNQGMQFLYGFNIDEAVRSFEEATRHDPECAMAWWAIAYASGPQMNNPTTTDSKLRRALDAVHKAQRLEPTASSSEQALIRAIAKRYVWPAPDDRTELDTDYTNAMEQAWLKNSNSSDIGALYAAALMYQQIGDYWTPEGDPKGRTPEIVVVLESVLSNWPDHPGANHYYIHAVESSPNPERAVAAADRLVTLVPGSGHLLHMPSHIYVRIGRYAEATDANQRAIAADESYFAVAPPPDYYLVIFLHNVHFLAYTAMMEGRFGTAISAAQKLNELIPEGVLREHTGYVDGLMATVYHVMIRFGRWDDILAAPEPPDFRLLSRAMWHYARGVAYAATGHTTEARNERARFEQVAIEVPNHWLIGTTPAHSLLPLARHMLEAEIAYREGRQGEAFEVLREGIALEDALVYAEPPGWMQPIRHALGSLLMSSALYADAEAIYSEDLEHNPNNGWSLLGLQQALLAQHRDEESRSVGRALESAWMRADVRPTSSCYCQPSNVTKLRQNTGPIASGK